MKSKAKASLVSVIMGSKSDFPTMNFACNILEEFSVLYSVNIVSAHRTPDRMFSFAKNAHKEGVKVIIAGAGGAAHLPGMVASLTHIPVIGVPVKSSALNGIDSLLSIVQMPGGVPVATMSIGEGGAKNAALLAISILALSDENLSKKLQKWRDNQSNSVPLSPV